MDVGLIRVACEQAWLQTKTDIGLENSKPKSDPSTVISVPPMDNNSKGLKKSMEGPLYVTIP